MALHVWFYAFLCDDAYIMFRYARNFARGNGLVFNPGEPVEGYTSLLWVLQLAIGYVLGVSGEIFPHVLSIGYTAGAAVLWVLFIHRQSAGRERRAVIVITLLILSVNRSWAVWATSGLETRSFTFYVLLTFYALTRAELAESRPRRVAELAGMSLALALAALSRPDAQAFFPLIVAFCLWTRRRTLSEILAMTGPFALLVGGQYLWRLSYYGVWLPNTYYAKTGVPWPQMGARYLAAFILEYGYYLVIPLVALMWRRVPSLLSRRLGVLFTACMGVHAAYYCYRIGGDHFEFRIFDFYAPLIAWMAAESLVALYARRPLAAVAVGTVSLVYSLVIPMSTALNTHLQVSDIQRELYEAFAQFKVTVDNTPIARWLPAMPQVMHLHRRLTTELNTHFIGTRQEEHTLVWRAFTANIELARGVAERSILPPMTIASANVGILGYCVDLPVVDLLGLTDAVAARSPVPNGWRFIAHERLAPAAYIEARHASVQVRSATRAPIPQGATVLLFAPPGRVNKTYSIRLGDGVWLNIVSWDPDWIRANFEETPTDLIPRKAEQMEGRLQ